MFHKLFRGQLTNSGVNAPNLTITNTTSQSLVIDFVNAPGDALVLAVSAPAGEQHGYFFPGPITATPGSGAIAQLAKIIVKPGETLARSNVGSAEVTGHYE
jgi:hypothetical protein